MDNTQLIKGFLIVFVLCTVCLVWIVFNLLSQIKQLEIKLKDAIRSDVEAGNFYNFLLAYFAEVYTKLKAVDLRGSFEADDEVGFTFKSILEIIGHVKFQIEKINTKRVATDKESNNTDEIPVSDEAPN